jgi:hypothetical protein
VTLRAIPGTWARFNTIIEHFARVGSHRLLIEVAALSLELALQRGARWVALRQLELARTHLAQLRQDRVRQRWWPAWRRASMHCRMSHRCRCRPASCWHGWTRRANRTRRATRARGAVVAAGAGRAAR